MPDTLQLAANAYFDNVKLVSFFSVPFLLAFLIPLLVPTPTYVALGASFLRTGSMYVDISMLEAAAIVASFMLSLFLVSFAVVAINIVIKSQRTFTSIQSAVINGIGKYVLSVFWLYLTAWAIMLIFNLVGYEFGVNNWLTPIVGLAVSLPLFYAPTAIVIDDQPPFYAVKASLNMVAKKFGLFVMWIVLAIASISAVDIIFIALGNSLPYSRFLVLTVNSLFILPFLIMYQVQIYLTKYTILK